MSTPTVTVSRAVRGTYYLDGLLAASASPRRAGALAASATFGWRAMLKIKHDPKQLTDVIVIPVVFTVLFTYIFGGALGGAPGHYLKTLLPGTLVMGITACTMYGGARLAQDVTTGVFDRFRSLAVALLVRDPATVMNLGLAVLIPPAFASNIFVQPRTMPGWLQAFVNVNPISHLTDAARDLMNDTSGTGGAVAWSLGAIAAVTLLFAPLAVRAYCRRT